MFGIGTWEFMLVLILALIVLGPTKLPGIAKSIGRGYAEFKRAAQELRDSIDGEVDISDFKNSINDAKRSLEGDIEFEDDSDFDVSDVRPSNFNEIERQEAGDSDFESLQTAEYSPEQNPSRSAPLDQEYEDQGENTPDQQAEEDTDSMDTSRDGIEDDNR